MRNILLFLIISAVSPVSYGGVSAEQMFVWLKEPETSSNRQNAVMFLTGAITMTMVMDQQYKMDGLPRKICIMDYRPKNNATMDDMVTALFKYYYVQVPNEMLKGKSAIDVFYAALAIEYLCK